MTPEAIVPSWRALAERVVTEYRAALGGDLVAVALFGSVARGQAGRESDLDLYVVTWTPQSALLDPRLDRVRRTIPEGQEYQALVREGCRPDPRPIYHTVEHLRRHPWILLDIAHHGVILYDSEGILAHELDAVRRRLQELGAKRVELPDGTWYWDLKPDWRPGDVIDL
jgi:uncharacterized protein